MFTFRKRSWFVVALGLELLPATLCHAQADPPECERRFSGGRIISTTAAAARSVFAADLDGDRDVDVLSASWDDDKIAWYENADGLGAFGPQRIITAFADGASLVFAADLDGDGDLDVLSASYFQENIAWYENTDGFGTFGAPRVVTVLANGASSVFAADVDGDDDIDVLSASAWNDEIAWYENTDGLGTFGAQRVITNAVAAPLDVFAADLDGDGDVDLLSASSSDDKIAWYENADGLGTFGAQRIITTAAQRAASVFAADLDGDGDVDVLSASWNDDKIAWYENTDGLGAFGPQRIITAIADGATSVFAADLDGDGDREVLSASSNDGRIAWYDNTDGLGNFGDQTIITSEARGAQSVFAADLDRDGDVDVLSASYYDNKIAWYANEPDCNGNGVNDACEADCNLNGRHDHCDVSDGISMDCDGSGVPDECETDCNDNGRHDDCDVADGTSADCGGNGVPDECEADCNSNDIADSCDIHRGTSMDCQPNGVPDECDLAVVYWDTRQRSEDVDNDGVPDECEACEAIAPAYEPLMSLRAVAVNGESIEPTNCLLARGGDVIETELRFSGWGPTMGRLRAYQTTLNLLEMYRNSAYGTVLPVGWDAPLPPQRCHSDGDCTAGIVCRSFQCVGPDHNPALSAFIDLSRDDFVLAGLAPISGVATSTLAEYIFFAVSLEGIGADDPGADHSLYGGTLRLVLSDDACGPFRIAFDIGWISDPHYASTLFVNEDNVPIIPGLQTLIIETPGCDCNGNGIPDPADVMQESASDCDGDYVLDECELAACTGDWACQDCNHNGVPDGCDMADGTSTDANHDGRPDDCFVAIPTVSEWGLVALTLLLMTGAKIGLGRRPIIG